MTWAWSSGRSATSYRSGMHRLSISFMHWVFSCGSSLKSAERASIMLSSSSLQSVEKLASLRCCSRHSLARALPGATSPQNCTHHGTRLRKRAAGDMDWLYCGQRSACMDHFGKAICAPAFSEKLKLQVRTADQLAVIRWDRLIHGTAVQCNVCRCSCSQQIAKLHFVNMGRIASKT